MASSSKDNCECGHLKNEHIFQIGGVTKWGFLGEGFFRTPQVGKGLCKKCMCPKYKPVTFLNSRKKSYSPREEISNITENRCEKCGHLLENHIDIGHEFKNNFKQ